MTVTVTVAPEPRVKPGLMESLVFNRPGTPAVHGWYAEVEVDGALFQVSQLAGETREWTADAAFPPGSSCPAFSNGFGARYLRTKVLQPEVAAAVEAAKPTAPLPPLACAAHQLPGYHSCTELCTAECTCREVFA